MPSNAHLVLRIGVAFAFLYPPLAAYNDQTSWTAYFPDFIRSLPVDTAVILTVFGLIEIAIAVWILSGWNIQIPAALATVLLVAIVAVNMPQFDVLFRDLSIAAMSLALALMPQPTPTPTS